MGPPPWVPTYHGLHAHQYSVVTTFINLPSHYCFRRMNDKCEIVTIIRALYKFSKPAVSAVRYPITAGKFSNSKIPIPDWIDCGAGRFTPIHTSLQAVSSPRGPHQSEWRQNLLCKHCTLHVLCCFDDKEMSINRYNRIAIKKCLISLRHKNECVNFAMKTFDIIRKRHYLPIV